MSLLQDPLIVLLVSTETNSLFGSTVGINVKDAGISIATMPDKIRIVAGIPILSNKNFNTCGTTRVEIELAAVIKPLTSPLFSV